MTEFVDDRTKEQRETHDFLVVGTDSFMSGWGAARGGTSIAAWACRYEHLSKVEAWVRKRTDMKRVRVCQDNPKRRYRAPRNAKHVHIYVVGDDHPAVTGA